jgi:hypothetical protein
MLQILPLRAVAFQLFFLTVAILVEAHVFHRRLKMNPKQSVQYAASLNLLTAVLGWIAFFLFLGSIQATVIPSDIKKAMLNFIFFDQLDDQSMPLLLFLGFFTFFATLGAKWLGLIGLDRLLGVERNLREERTEEELIAAGIEVPRRRKAKESVFVDRSPQSQRLRPRLETVLSACAQSYTVILLLLLFRFLSATVNDVI